jgi:hypothetical protein
VSRLHGFVSCQSIDLSPDSEESDLQNASHCTSYIRIFPSATPTASQWPSDEKTTAFTALVLTGSSSNNSHFGLDANNLLTVQGPDDYLSAIPACRNPLAVRSEVYRRQVNPIGFDAHRLLSASGFADTAEAIKSPRAASVVHSAL